MINLVWHANPPPPPKKKIALTLSKIWVEPIQPSLLNVYAPKNFPQYRFSLSFLPTSGETLSNVLTIKKPFHYLPSLSVFIFLFFLNFLVIAFQTKFLLLLSFLSLTFRFFIKKIKNSKKKVLIIYKKFCSTLARQKFIKTFQKKISPAIPSNFFFFSKK